MNRYKPFRRRWKQYNPDDVPDEDDELDPEIGQPADTKGRRKRGRFVVN